MDEITQKALKLFQENMKYFEEHHKIVFEKISLLNQVIDEGVYEENYALEYKDEGYFDILELSSNEFLYKSNSIEASQRMVDTIDLKRTGAVFKGQKYVRATDEQADAIDKSELSFHNALWATIKIINYVNKYATPETFMNRVYKIIFLGIGLGYHLQGLSQKLNPQVMFIKERNLETFRLSLFVTNYTELAKDRFLHFSLTDNEKEESENFLAFLNQGNNYNLHLKHIPFTLDYQLDLQRLQSHVLSQSYINYGYSAILLRYIDSPKYLIQNYAFMNIMARYHGIKGNIFSQKPVLMVFSGPSTSKNIAWLKKYQDRFIIISALSTCRLLQANGLTPNIVIHIDPDENSALLFEGIDEKAYFKDVITILASNVDEKTVSKFKRENIYFIEQGTEYKKGFGYFSAPSVGEYTLGLMMILGISNMYMLGIDLALDPETLQTHGGYHPYQSTGTINTQTASLDVKHSTTYVKGNFLEEVPTLEPFKLSIEQAKFFTEKLKKEYHHIYNLSNGAYLEGCEPLHIETFDWMQLEREEREEVQEKIVVFFNSISEAQFNEQDRLQMIYQIKEAKKLEKIIKVFKKKKFATVDAYLRTLAQLSWNLSDMENKTHSNLAQVYYEYFQIILSYICDLFNTKDLTNPSKHMVQINAILVKQLLKISTLYISKLEGYLK
ncbi:hypothetical protein SJPD1_2802 [Sulfurospirillum diekertiae]|uniref:Motility accessory factor n=1 Tax=Sulfurospirillum diekertiae TaxID=1854492 RepID=A0A290HZ12_9BACT|nr:6-hydroxymethylpterin diphosphokinase MptE-like protein [Sulfurospirillum diekertiae]ATB70890.1 hypothetical protein SJPD1_2802 [Sulfurospirillum diekertiae]